MTATSSATIGGSNGGGNENNFVTIRNAASTTVFSARSVATGNAGASGNPFRANVPGRMGGTLASPSVCMNTAATLSAVFNSLHIAAGYGHKEIVERLLASGASVHTTDDSLLVPLHNAASFGHVEIVKILLLKGACPNAQVRFNTSSVLISQKVKS